MKKTSTSLFNQMSIKKIESLTTIVKETLAGEYNSSNSKVFTAADLWNIQRQGRSRMQRRFSL